MRRELLLVAVVALAGCSLPFVGHPDEPPGGDTIGWENGYWYDDSVSVTTDDGLNESEREAVVARQMARIERIRDREFQSTVPVDVISRAEYRNRSGSGGSAVPDDPWNDQVWEALLLVGESTGSGEAISDTRSNSVLGYYSPSSDRIVVVSPTETPVVSRSTLAHELVHALQDQQFDMNGSRETQDTQLSRNGVIEGEANYIQQIYQQQCNQEWDCIETPESDSGGDGSSANSGRNPGVFTVILQPYVSGPQFINTIYGQGGWDAVDALHDDFPASSEQVIHPQRYPNETPADVTVPDRSNAEWNRFDHDPVGDTVGEASIFATMYHNDRTDADRYSYVSTPSEGWDGDTVVPYHTDSGAGGYVWVSRWDSEADAEEFAGAYRDALLEEHDASRDGDVYVVPDGPYADAFRITRSGDTVRIVNGPTVADLDGIHDPA